MLKASTKKITMSVKLVEKAAVAAWSPMLDEKGLLVLGSCPQLSTGGSEVFTQTDTELEIYSLDANSKGPLMSMHR